MIETIIVIIIVIVIVILVVIFYFLVHFAMPFLLVRSGEAPIADLARERLLARVRSYVSGQMVGARESPRAYMTLERLITGVNA